MRICRIASFPTKESPGTGLPVYYLLKAIRVPTLFLTRKAENLLEVPPHVELKAIRYTSPAFDKKINPWKMLLKLLGIMHFFLLSIPSLVRFGPDIVHIHSPLHLPHAAFSRLFLGAKVCMTFHGSDLVRIERGRFFKALLVRIVDVFFYVSNSMRAGIAEFVPEGRMVYTPNGVDPYHFRDLGLRREKQIVAVGNLRWQKGYEFLIDAFSRIDAYDYRLVIVGEGPLRKKLMEKISRSGMEGRILLPGRKNHEEITQILNQSQIYAMSSLSEGFPKALIEGIASGLPVVVTDAGCCRELSRDVGICVSKADADEFAAALDVLIKNSTLRKEYSKNTKRIAARYGWEVACRSVSRTYEDLTNERIDSLGEPSAVHCR